MAGIAIYALLHVTKPQPVTQHTSPPTDQRRGNARHQGNDSPHSSRVRRGSPRSENPARGPWQAGCKITRITPAFIEGGQLEPGEVLLAIEDTDYRAAVDERLPRVAATKGELEQALADADVARKQLAGQPNPCLGGGENGGLPTTLSAVMGGTLPPVAGLLIGLDAAIDTNGLRHGQDF